MIGQVAPLVQAAAAGDERAWSVLVGRFSALIRSVARRHQLREADQDEVVQRTWMRLFERIATLREPSALPGWLGTTARHESLRVLEASAREVPGAEEFATAEAVAEGIHELVAAAERRAAVHRAIGDLPGHQRAMMRVLLAEPALSYREVGAKLGVPVGSVGPTRVRALSRLRRDTRLCEVVGEDR
jgi:RNA polymerase sigma factor (sigma-70 family)